MVAIQVQAPNGDLVEFPAGTPDTTIKDVMARNYGGPKQPVSLQTFRQQYPQYGDMSDRQLADALHAKFYADMPKADFDRKIGLKSETWGEYGKGLLRSATQGLTFNFGDELGLVDKAKADEFAAEHPIASTVASIAGSLPLFAAGPGAAAARWATGGANLLRTAGRSAAFGAGLGAASGFGAGEGDVADRLPSAATGAGVGGVLGGVVPPAFAAGGRAVDAARSLMPSRPNPSMLPPPVQPAGTPEFVAGRPIEGATFVDERTAPALGAQDRAAGLIRDQLLRGGESVQGLRDQLAALERARTMRPNSTAADNIALADISPSLQRLAGAAWRAYPEASRDINSFITARQTGTSAAGMDVQDLARRGIPTREPFAAPETVAQAEKRLGAHFAAGGQDSVLPQGHTERVRDMLRRSFEISDSEYHRHARSGLRTIEKIVSDAEEAAKSAYAAAYEANKDINLRNVVLPIFQRHIQRAALEESTDVERHLMKIQNLFLRPRRSIVLRQFDNTKRELDGMIKDDLSKPKYTHRGAVLTQLKNDLLAAVDAATDGSYAAARQEFSDSMSMARAYQLGRRSLDDRQTLRRTGPLSEMPAGAEVTADAIPGLTEGELKLFKFGVLDSVTARSMRVPRIRENLQIYETPRVQELLRSVIARSKGKSAEFHDRPERVSAYLDFERAMQGTRDTVRGNSMTARNLQDDMMLAGAETAQNVQGFMDMVRGSTSMWHMGQMLLTKYIDRAFGMGADTARELSRLLFTANPAEREAILQRLAAIMPSSRMARFNELMAQAARVGIGPGAGLAGGAAASPNQPSFPSFL